MFLTNALLKKTKTKNILVMMESVVSNHQITRWRERLADKLEFVYFDPYIQRDSLYKELGKICSIKDRRRHR